MLAVQRQPGANAVAVVDAVQAQLPTYRAQVPAAIDLEVLADRSISIRNSVSDVEFTLGIAITLVILVIFLFLRSVPATIIPALAVPVSLIGTCAVMYALNFSINNMTMLALTLSVGFVVDDAIVMLENIVRYIEGGMRPFEAALKGSKEIGFTIVAITFSLIAVFIPVLLMGGMVGRVFREFAVTIAFAIMISGFVSLTLTPMLCARVLRNHHEGEKQNFLLRLFEAGFNACLKGYEWALDRVLKYKAITLAVTFATLAATVYLYIAIPKGFFPTEDTGFIAATTEAATDISFPAMSALQAKVSEIVLKDKAVDYVNPSVGPGGVNPTPNTGRIYIALKPRSERLENSTAVIQRLRVTANTVPGMSVYFQNVQNINITGRPSKSEYQYSLQSSDTEALFRLAPEMRDRIAKVPGLRDVNSDLYIKNPQMNVEIDREKAGVYGITIDQIRQELFDAFGARQVATIYTPTNDYQVILESKPEFQTDVSALSRIYVKTAAGVSVPLESVTKLVPAVGPLLVNHQANQPSVTISFNLAPGYSIGQAVGRNRRHRTGSAAAGVHHLRLPGISRGLPGLAQRSRRAGAGGDLCRLCAPWHPVRKLHTPDHDHFRPAFGRCGCPAHADGLQDGSFGHRHDRHRDVGGYRQEERHHDDRFRDRAPTGRHERRGGDARGLSAALPAHHDDDLCGDFRCSAGRDRGGGRGRVAAAARHSGRGRPVPVAAADVVHHAGHLHLSRPRRPHAQATAGAAAGRGARAASAARSGGGGIETPSLRPRRDRGGVLRERMRDPGEGR